MRIFFVVVTLLIVILCPCFAGTWTQLPSSPVYNGIPPNGQVLVNDQAGHLYLTGGYTGNWTFDRSFATYDIASNTWTRLADTPCDVERNAGFYDGNGHFVVNRGNWSNQLLSYDITANTWSYLSSAPSGTMMYNAAAYAGNGIGYFTGGMWDQTLYSYNVGSDTWAGVTTTPEDMANNSMTYDGGGHLFATVGETDWTPRSNHFYMFDIAVGAWSRMADLPNTSNGHVIVCDNSGGILLIGGDGTQGIYRYAIGSNIWTKLDDLPGSFWDNGAVYDAATNSVYFTTNTTNNFYRYTPVPEPSGLIAFFCGIGGLGGMTRLKRRWI